MMNLPPKTVLYRDLIELRLLSPRDGAAIFQAVKESLPSLQKFMNWAHYDGDLVKACSIYADFEAKSLKGEEAHFAGFDPSSGEFLLCASLSPGSHLNRLAFDMGYWVSAKHQDCGFGTQAAKILTVLAFSYFQAERLSVVCNLENSASLRVVEKCGFHFEGILRNYLSKQPQHIIANGLSPITDVSSYSLVPEDISRLSWFEEIQRDLFISRFDDL